MCKLCDKIKDLEIEEAYSMVKKEVDIDKKHEKEIYEELAKRYHREVVQFLPCSD